MDTYPETTTTLTDFPETLRWLRQMRQMKLRDTAETTGLSVSYISDLEHGRVMPSLLTLQKLAAAYNAPIAIRFSA